MGVLAPVALALALVASADAGKPGGGSTGPEFTLTNLGAATVYCIDDEGVVGGERLESDGFFHPILIVPSDEDGNGRPDCWFKDADNDGINDLMAALPFLGGTESSLEGRVNAASGGLYVGGSTSNVLSEYGYPKGHACLWMDDDGDGFPEAHDLGVSLTGVGSVAYAVNDDGWVLVKSGVGQTNSYLIVPVDGVWNDEESDFSDADGVNDLMIYLGDSVSAVDIADDGRIVCNKGSGVVLLSPSDADGDGIPDSFSETALTGLGGDTSARSIHSSGRVAGSSFDGSAVHAVHWKPDLSIVDLGAPSRGFTACAMDLFVDGTGTTCVVGKENKPPKNSHGTPTTGTNVGLYWVGTTKYVLYSQLTDKTGLAGIENATDVNTSGVFIGSVKTTAGAIDAYVAVPASN
jgi:hypothetical protein